MLEGSSRDDNLDSASDFFSTLGGETRKKNQPPPASDPDTVRGVLHESLVFAETPLT
jgi:hypothetical protein